MQLPTRREHKWAGLSEPIGRYVLVRAVSDDGFSGWGEAPALKDWGGEFGRYFGESPLIAEAVVNNYLSPAVTGVEVGNIVEAHARMDEAVKGYPYAKAAVETAADGIMVSSLYGQGELDCRGFRDLCVEAGLDSILLYVGGNLVVGKTPWNVVEKRFLDMGFDRAFPPGARTREVVDALDRDFAARARGGRTADS